MKKTLLSLIAIFLVVGAIAQEGWTVQYFNADNDSKGTALCAVDENLVYVIATDGNFFKTTDGGTNWDLFTTGVLEYFHDLYFYNSQVGLAVGENGSIIRTINGGVSWDSIPSGTTSTLFSIAITTTNTVWIVGDNGVVLHSNTDGSLILDESLTDEKLNNIAFNTANIGYIVGDNGTLLQSLNAGNDWSVVDLETTDDLFSLSITENHSYLLAGDSDGFYGNDIYQSLDNTNWTSVPTEETEMLGEVSKLYYYNDNIGFAMGIQYCLCDCVQFLINKNIGATYWAESCVVGATIEGSAIFWYPDIDFVTPQIGYVLNGKFVLKTIDGGTNTFLSGLNTDDYDTNQLFNLYPNPVINTSFSIDFNTLDTKEMSIEIIDINGRKLLSKENLTSYMNIDLLDVVQGVYFVKLLKNNQTIAIEKLVKTE